MRGENHAVGHGEIALGGFGEGECRDFFECGIAQVFADVHGVVGVAVFQHSLGNGSRGVFLVGEHTYFVGPLDECFIEFGPRASRERDDAHVVIRHQQSVGQHLQGVERRIDDDVGLGHLALDGIRKT